MNNRGRTLAALNYKAYDRLPVVYFGFWKETLKKWCDEGHLKAEEIENIKLGNINEKKIGLKLGFDFNWADIHRPNTNLSPVFERKIIEKLPDGSVKSINEDGVVIIEKEGVVSIPTEIDHILKERKDWEQHYLPKLQFSTERVLSSELKEYVDVHKDGDMLGLHCGSLFGRIRNWMGVEQTCYMLVDDEELYNEIIDTVGNLCYRVVEEVLKTGIKFDYAHFWEDICFKNGPLVIPDVFGEKVGKYYKNITELLKKYDINIVSLDCDGCIDTLVPIWLKNGVNTMFPIEVGTWSGNIKPWREKYGKDIRGVGGFNKNVFAMDYGSIDKEIERLRPLIEMGGYIPCPDHLIPPDAKWENVQYYTEKIKELY